MATRTVTCTAPVGRAGESCGGEIRPSYTETAVSVGGALAKRDVIHPAACERCATTYADVVSIAMTLAEIDTVGQRLSPSTQHELEATATELTPDSYEIELTEVRARDFASKAANLGLMAISDKVREKLRELNLQRRQRQM
jgi:hypothetical protein